MNIVQRLRKEKKDSREIPIRMCSRFEHIRFSGTAFFKHSKRHIDTPTNDELPVVQIRWIWEEKECVSLGYPKSYFRFGVSLSKLPIDFLSISSLQKVQPEPFRSRKVDPSIYNRLYLIVDERSEKNERNELLKYSLAFVCEFRENTLKKADSRESRKVLCGPSKGPF